MRFSCSMMNTSPKVDGESAAAEGNSNGPAASFTDERGRDVAVGDFAAVVGETAGADGGSAAVPLQPESVCDINTRTHTKQKKERRFIVAAPMRS